MKCRRARGSGLWRDEGCLIVGAKQRKSFPLRLDPELYRLIEEWAQSEMRSVNGQIEFILRQAARKHFEARRLPEAEVEPADDDREK